MKKIIGVLLTMVFISINLIGCSNNKGSTYTIEKHQEIKVGKDIPAGKYRAEILDNYTSTFNISPIENKEEGLIQYGESLPVTLTEEKADNGSFISEVILPKGKLIASETNLRLTKK